jgi:hypothetical protein
MIINVKIKMQIPTGVVSSGFACEIDRDGRNARAEKALREGPALFMERKWCC